jgi:hypothetical protein
MNEGICDFRFAICDLAAPQGRDTRGGHYGRQICSQPNKSQIANRNSKIS